MINFDNSFFKKINLTLIIIKFKENLILANEKSEEISKEFYSGKSNFAIIYSKISKKLRP